MSASLKFILGFLLCFSVSKTQTLNYYFGNLHSHSGYSDGNKDSLTTSISKPAGNFAYAKLSQNFDFLGISEHNHYSSNNNPGMVRTSYSLGLAETAAANTGTFLALYGMEWGVSSTDNGHLIIYGFNQLIGWENTVPGLTGPNYDIFNAKTDYQGIFTLVKNNPNAFCYLAHPATSDYFGLVNAYNAMNDSAICGVPFRSGPAFDDSENYSTFASGDYFWYYRNMLKRGYHVGIGYDHDNHYLNFGRGNAGRLVIMAPTLTQPNLVQAMQKMHFYGSDDWNAKIDFKIGTNIMGDTLSGTSYPTINVVHNDGDGELADSIKVWAGVAGSGSNPVIIKTVKASNTLMHTDNTILTDYKQKYYFIEIVQLDGDHIITSPIWYIRRDVVGIQERTKDLPFIMFPNPTNSKLHISTGLNTNYTIQIFDVAGKIIFSEDYSQPDITISTNQFEKGFYTLKVSNGEASKTNRLIIE